jgi:UDP-N-acetylmuramoyl-tripeptide--D-alanyl-D-alanine ligase
MLAALENFTAMRVQPKTLILGDMLELGARSGEEHQRVIDFVQRNMFENVLLVGENFCRTENHPYRCFHNTGELNEYLSASEPITDNYILIKGSRSIQLEKCADWL